jgi:hypothetical protein
METILVPDALTVGLGWDIDQSTDYDLLAAAFSESGQNLGFIQGTAEHTALFGKGIVHTGDNDGTMVDTVLGDSENIVFDLRAVPPECSSILFGALLITPPTNVNASKPYLHMLPLLREETINAQIASGGTRTIQYEDSDDESDSDESDSNSNAQPYGTRGITDSQDDEEAEDRHKFVKLFHAELSQYPDMLHQKGFVAGKLFRNGNEWYFTPYRTVVQADPQYGLWSALEYYAKYPNQMPQQQQQLPQSFGGYPPQNYGQPPSQNFGYGSQPPPQNYGQPISQNFGYGSQPPHQDFGYGSQQPGYGLPPPQNYGFGSQQPGYGQHPPGSFFPQLLIYLINLNKKNSFF